jgi:shikimate kinase
VNLEEMLQLRQPMYAAFANATIDNNGLPQTTAAKIVAYWEEIA